MRMSNVVQAVEELTKELSVALDSRQKQRALERAARRYLDCDFVGFYCGDRLISEQPAAHEVEFEALPLSVRGSTASLAGITLELPLFIGELDKARIEPALRAAMQTRKIRSCVLAPVFKYGQLAAVMEVRFVQKYHRWRKEDCLLVEQLAFHAGQHLGGSQPVESGAREKPLLQRSAQPFELQSQYQRLANYGNLLVVRTSSEMTVTDVFGDTAKVLGRTPEEILRDRNIWRKIVHPGDLRRLILKSQKGRPSDLSEEIRVINQKSGLVRWLLLRAVPCFDSSERFLGWEGYGVDITDKHNAQEELRSQGRRIEALYAVARSLQVRMDPAVVTLKGLRALIRATKSSGGLGCLFNPAVNELEIVAAEGLSSAYIEGMTKYINDRTLARRAVEEKKGFMIADIQSEPRVSIDMARRENLHATIIMPLLFENNSLGAVVLYSRRTGHYSAADFDLIEAAASQIALAVREAELHAAEKRQSASLASLYRLSHELSKQVTLKEVIAHAFPVIHDELACKRMWLGVINEQSTHLVGQAGFGPRVRDSLAGIRVDLNSKHQFLDEALKTKQPVVVPDTQAMECSELNPILERLSCEALVIVPLVALGQVMGVLIVEPAGAAEIFAQSKLPLLSSMAGEIANVILARRFEARMADADKMRMANLLASGIAHNFNNMLQAVMGQASLIEMQSPGESSVAGSARIILEAANRGAALIKQLHAFSAQEGHAPRVIEINKLISETRELFKSVLGSRITLELALMEEAIDVKADYARIQQVITNLLLNAKDAIGAKENGCVRISSSKVRLHPGEIDPELAPGAYLRLDVQDNGTGMDAERCARCFEPFFTTKNADSQTGLGFAGSGLGLSSAYTIMRQHEGLITVRSELGQGSTFSLYLPVAVLRAGQSEGGLFPDSSSGPVQNRTAILFDLTESDAFVFRAALESLKTTVKIAADRQSVVNSAKEDPKETLLVVVDLDRVGTGSLELIRWLERRCPAMTVVAATSEGRRWAPVLRAYANTKIFQKPVSIWTVNSLLRNLQWDQEKEPTPGATAEP